MRADRRLPRTSTPPGVPSPGNTFACVDTRAQAVPSAIEWHGPRRHGPGFTIIELLSVVAIIGVLSAIAIPHNQEAIDQAKIARAIGDLRVIATDLNTADSLPMSLAAINRDQLLDPWGRPYVYLRFGKAGIPGSARTDRFVVPVNSRFDLYSLGPDGLSTPPLIAAGSGDDVIMGSDGGYYGVGSKY